MAGTRETHGFQTEIRQLLDLMIHSLYSNKEIFVRELISNASDAADKLRFEALSDDSLYEGDGELEVRLEVDKEARTVTVRDNGVGMDQAEIIDNLGTIAKSGTRQFFDALTGDQAADARLIGQFGVGFYSSFIVGDNVTVTTRRAGGDPSDGVRWESTGEGEFTVEQLDVPRRGTEVVVHIREGEDELLDPFRVRSIVRKYSDHISIPIRMPKDTGDSDGETETETVNSATALWTRSRNEIEREEYDEFYKHVAHDFEAPLAHVHSRVEGNLEYTSLLFIPSRAPFDLWDRNVRRGVKLYVRRVFIMDDAEQLMPGYLRFVRGIVDSADLPLNVSRELLQSNRQIESIRSGSVKRVLDLLENIAKNEPDKYATFWGQFGRVLKEGVIEDAKNREQIARLLRFASTHDDSEEPAHSFVDYVSRMNDGQDKIHFITADNHRTAINSPHLEVFREKGVEVLVLTDDVDEWLVHHIEEFEGKPLQSVTKGELDLDDETGPEEGVDAPEPGDHGDLLGKFRDALGERIKDVRVTNRLRSSPACLVADEHEMGRHMERILEAAGQKIEGARPTLEVNPDHVIVRRFAEESDASLRGDLAHILFDQAVLSEGGRLGDRAAFVRRMNDVFLAVAQASPAASSRPKKKPATRKKAAASKRKKSSRKSNADGAPG